MRERFEELGLEGLQRAGRRRGHSQRYIAI
jgi:hypothetical protein